VKVTLLYFDDCPHWKQMAAQVDRLAQEIPGIKVDRQTVTTPEEAAAIGFRGSPSVLIEGIDAFIDQAAPVGLSCRVYETPSGPSGNPSFEQLRERLTSSMDRS
jgi:hypothetical protein